MQLKTDKCNFIHLGRCVKSGAPNIPHDSPWLIFPWSETPIISHEPNSTRMARRSPRGQFSGHLPLTHCSLEGERRRGGDRAAKRGQRHEGEGPRLRGEESRGGDEWAWGGTMEEVGSWRPLARRMWVGWGVMEKPWRDFKERKQGRQRENLHQHEHLPKVYPDGIPGSWRSHV